MDAVINAIDAAFEGAANVIPEILPREEEQLISASQIVAQQADAMDARKRAEGAKRHANQTTKEYVTQSPTVIMDADGCETFIQDEMKYRAENARWYSMDMCFKWKKIQQYVEDADLPESTKKTLMSQMPFLLRSGTLNSITYDSTTQRVTKLNHGDI